MIKLEDVTFTYPESDFPVFIDLNVELPSGLCSFMGQNGTGKSTVLLLAGGRLLPERGSVTVLDRRTADFKDEEERNRYVSFVYQNMEFESEEPIQALMEQVLEGGRENSKDSALISTLVREFELEAVANKKIQSVSKGELQRAIMAFSLLYGSPVIMMDEPIFALEFEQKERTMGFVRELAKQRSLSIYFAIHEFEISRRYSDWVLLFSRDRTTKLGPTAEILTRENIEEAYEIPYGMLYQQERLHRTHLLEASNFLKDRSK
ncbi:MAG TPA: ABC transporter ATP-binding protein [Spirochaetia bacterium]|nr:ABC transporter ATP-binding protein [Spirochaetia bacterium]